MARVCYSENLLGKSKWQSNPCLKSSVLLQKFLRMPPSRKNALVCQSSRKICCPSSPKKNVLYVRISKKKSLSKEIHSSVSSPKKNPPPFFCVDLTLIYIAAHSLYPTWDFSKFSFNLLFICSWMCLLQPWPVHFLYAAWIPFWSYDLASLNEDSSRKKIPLSNLPNINLNVTMHTFHTLRVPPSTVHSIFFFFP